MGVGLIIIIINSLFFLEKKQSALQTKVSQVLTGDQQIERYKGNNPQLQYLVMEV